MSKIPRISATQVVKTLFKIGYRFDHQTGSHVILRNTQPPFRRAVVPNRKEIPRGTLKAIIREAGLTNEEFLNLLD
jgi:predicted RNA binding protein YcfA (HicA-like mRNA interferase family)